MLRVHIICEGQTEEAFVKSLLIPHFATLEISLYPALLGKPGHKGGNVRFERLLTDTRNRLKGDTEAYCTTFFDYYALPTDFPGKDAAARVDSSEEKANCIEVGIKQELEIKVGSNSIRRFIPYVQMYEFEALLFSDPRKFAHGIAQPFLEAKFQSIRNSCSTPEDINDSPETAPSKRVEKLVSGYEKPLYGTLAALEIGLDKMRSECSLFDSWLKKIEALRIE